MDRIQIEDYAVEFFLAFRLKPRYQQDFADMLCSILLDGVSSRDALKRCAEKRNIHMMALYGMMQNWVKPCLFNDEYYNAKWMAMREYWGVDSCRPTIFGIASAVAATLKELTD